MNVEDVLGIDFETGSRADLKKTGAATYAEHPSTRVLCMAYQFPGGKPDIWIPGTPFPRDVIDWVRAGKQVSGWNVMFEFWIWNVVLRRQLKAQPVPRIEIDQLVDTMLVAAYNGLPLSLDMASEAMPELGVTKDKEGHALMLRMSRPRQTVPCGDPAGPQDRWWHEEDPARYDRLQKYCIHDVVVERTILKVLDPLPGREVRIARMDMRANERGMLLDAGLAEAIKDIAEAETGRLDAEMHRVTNGQVPTSRAVGKLLKWAQGLEPKIMSLAKDQLATWIAKTSKAGNMIKGRKILREALLIRQEAAKSSVAKVNAMQAFAGADGRMRGLYQTYAALRTGRDGGRGPQLQNYPRGSVKDQRTLVRAVLALLDSEGFQLMFGVPAMEALASVLRGCITVPKGKKFVSFDFSQIEARVLPWLAGDGGMLNVFRSGRDVYKVSAAGIYGMPEDAVGDESDERQVGKVSVLALGFGGGVGAFQAMAKIYGIEITDEQAESIKVAWREANPKIVQFWYALDHAAIKTVKTGRPHAAGNHILFEKRGPHLLMRLPVGRSLYYRNAKIGLNHFDRDCVTYMGRNQYTMKWDRIDTYGGKLAENATQAVARDVLKDASLRIDAQAIGVDLLGPVHDELLLEVEPGYGGIDAQEALIGTLMRAKAAWAGDLPVDATGYVSDRYRK